MTEAFAHPEPPRFFFLSMEETLNMSSLFGNAEQICLKASHRVFGSHFSSSCDDLITHFSQIKLRRAAVCQHLVNPSDWCIRESTQAVGCCSFSHRGGDEQLLLLRHCSHGSARRPLPSTRAQELRITDETDNFDKEEKA